MECALDQVRPTVGAARSFLSAHKIGSAEADVCEMALVEACYRSVKEHRAVEIAEVMK